jgi:hypothetical protein
MKSSPDSTDAHPPQPVTSVGIFLARLFWALVGPVMLLLATGLIMSRGPGWFSGFDVFFATVAGLMFLARFAEYWAGTSTLAQVWRYVMVVHTAAACLWVVANVLGNHVLN